MDFKGAKNRKSSENARQNSGEMADKRLDGKSGTIRFTVTGIQSLPADLCRIVSNFGRLGFGQKWTIFGGTQ